MIERDEVRRQMQRLSSHVLRSARQCDDITLLDLASSLRNWADMKEGLREAFPEFADRPIFETATHHKRVRKALANYPHVLAVLPGGVHLPRTVEEIFGGPDHDGDSSWDAAVEFTYLGKSEIVVRSLAFKKGPNIDPELVKFATSKKALLKKLNFSAWLGSEVVRIRCADSRGELGTHALTREQVIRRVANGLGGSHPRMSDSSANALDLPLAVLSQYRVCGVPLPQVLSVKVAQDILSAAEGRI